MVTELHVTSVLFFSSTLSALIYCAEIFSVESVNTEIFKLPQADNYTFIVTSLPVCDGVR